MPPPLHGQEIFLDCTRDELVPDREAAVAVLDEEAVLEALGDPGDEIGIQDAIAAAGMGCAPRR